MDPLLNKGTTMNNDPSKTSTCNDSERIENDFARGGRGGSWRDVSKDMGSNKGNKSSDDVSLSSKTVRINPRHSMMKSCSESDLRILSNPPPKLFSCSNECVDPQISPIRSDYVTVVAAAKRAEGLGLHSSFRKRIIRQSSAVCGHADSNESTNTIVVIPSIDLDGDELKRICPNIEFYEERQLYHLLLLADPTFRVVFLSTNQICEDIVQYYLSLDNCNIDELSERRRRLFLMTPGDLGGSHPSLSKKVVNHDKLISTIREIVDRISGGVSPSAGLNVFCGSDTADLLASKLKLRLLEASCENLYYGSKQGR